jgi:hypothetical protein
LAIRRRNPSKCRTNEHYKSFPVLHGTKFQISQAAIQTKRASVAQKGNGSVLKSLRNGNLDSRRHVAYVQQVIPYKENTSMQLGGKNMVINWARKRHLGLQSYLSRQPPQCPQHAHAGGRREVRY